MTGSHAPLTFPHHPSRGSCSSCGSCSNLTISLGCSFCQYATCAPDSTLNIGALVGGIIGGILLLALVITLFSLCCCSQRYHYSNYYGGGGYGGAQTTVITNQAQAQPVAYPPGYEQPMYPQQPYGGYPQQLGGYPPQQNAGYPPQPQAQVRDEEYSPTEPMLPGSVQDEARYPNMQARP